MERGNGFTENRLKYDAFASKIGKLAVHYSDKRRRTVLHILSSAGVGGGEQYLYDLVHHSSGLIKYKILLPHNGPFAKRLNKNGYSYTIVSQDFKYFLPSLKNIIRKIKKHRIEIIHTHGYRPNLYGRLACLFTNAKHIATAHISLWDYADTPMPIRFLYILLERLLSFKTYKYLCVSEAMQKDLLKMKIAKKKLELIPNGVDLDRFFHSKSRETAKRELGIDLGIQLIGTVGRMVNEKGQIFLLKALSYLKCDINNVRCLFVGSGPLSGRLRWEAQNLGVEKMCIFAGIQTMVESIYPAMDIFVLPSVREPFGIAILEAMASKIPVIATSAGGPLDFIKPGVNGILVPPKNPERLSTAIKSLLLDGNKAVQMAEAGRKTVERYFDIKTAVQRIESLYSSI